MKLKELEYFLSGVKPFPHPKLHLEQYATDSHIAARMIYTGFEDIEGKRVVDLGCGCGMLSLACLYAGATSVLGVDIDSDALDQFRRNVKNLDLDNNVELDLVQASILDASRWGRTIMKDAFDVAVLNPPFGTKNNEGIDVQFLRQAMGWAPIVYSLHKSTTRDYICRVVKSWYPNASVKVMAQVKFLIPRLFKFHKQEHVYVDVDLVRVTRQTD